MKVNITATTDGQGYWSRTVEKVRINKLEIGYKATNTGFGELRAYFDPKKWDVKSKGLIYTDKRWMREFKEGLLKIGFSKVILEDLEYSEQGMQGNDYVSMDFDGDFYQRWLKLGGEEADMD